MQYPVGKLPNAVLAKLLSETVGPTKDARVLVGPRVGEDAAVLDFGETCLVVSTDPITLATENLGWYAVHVNANDVAVRGAQPRWFSAVLLLAEGGTDDALVNSIFTQVYDACAALGCTLIGGHTEISAGLARPIIIGQMLGEVRHDKLVTTRGAKVGDALLLTKGIALEGTALLAQEKANQLVELGVPEVLLARAQNLLFDPGISVVRDALAANAAVAVHAMHDPTEGGVATALAEMAEASGVGVILEQEHCLILPECKMICAALGLDPLGTLASGALLLALAQADVQEAIRTFAGEGIPCAQIGTIVPHDLGLRMQTKTGMIDLPRFERDEITKAL